MSLMERTPAKRVLLAIFSAVVPGLGQVIKKERKKAAIYFAVLVVLMFLAWPIRLQETELGLLTIKIGTFCLSLVASLDAMSSTNRPWYLTIVCILAAIFVGDTTTGGIMFAQGFRAYSTPTESMEPSVMKGDRLIADGKYYDTRRPQRGDIVLARVKSTVMKRVIAVEGDVIRGSAEQVWVNDQLLQEPYAQYTGVAAAVPLREFGPIRVLPGKLFLPGDNRDVSWDSRDPEFGQVSAHDLAGKPLYVYFSRTPRRWGKRID